MQAPGLPRGFEITAKAVGGVPEPAPPAPQGAEGGGGVGLGIRQPPCAGLETPGSQASLAPGSDLTSLS